MFFCTKRAERKKKFQLEEQQKTQSKKRKQTSTDKPKWKQSSTDKNVKALVRGLAHPFVADEPRRAERRGRTS